MSQGYAFVWISVEKGSLAGSFGWTLKIKLAVILKESQLYPNFRNFPLQFPACSRQVKELRDSGLISTLHCTSSGDYEPLQCDTDSGICYCVDEKTGRLNGAVMPQSSWTKLPCLTPNVTNFMKDGKYLRKCESQFAAIQSIIQEGHEHNEDYSLREFKCDYDGSYAPRQDSGTRRDCVYKNGTTIKDYFDSNQKQKDCSMTNFPLSVPNFQETF